MLKVKPGAGVCVGAATCAGAGVGVGVCAGAAGVSVGAGVLVGGTGVSISTGVGVGLKFAEVVDGGVGVSESVPEIASGVADDPWATVGVGSTGVSVGLVTEQAIPAITNRTDRPKIGRRSPAHNLFKVKSSLTFGGLQPDS